MKVLPKDLLKYLESDKNRVKLWLENYKKLIEEDNSDKTSWREKIEERTEEKVEKPVEKTYQFNIPVLKRRFPVYEERLSSAAGAYIPLDYDLFKNAKRTFVFIYHNGVKYLKLEQGWCIVIETEYPENPVVAELDTKEPPLLKLYLRKEEGHIDLRVEIGQC